MIPIYTLASFGPGHRRLLIQELPMVVRHVMAMSKHARVPPWELVMFVLDLRSMFGAEAAWCLVPEPGRIERAVELAEAQGRIPALTVPLTLDLGVELIRACVPDLHEQVVNRAPRTMPLIAIDADDAALMIAVDRAPYAGSA